MAGYKTMTWEERNLGASAQKLNDKTKEKVDEMLNLIVKSLDFNSIASLDEEGLSALKICKETIDLTYETLDLYTAVIKRQENDMEELMTMTKKLLVEIEAMRKELSEK